MRPERHRSEKLRKDFREEQTELNDERYTGLDILHLFGKEKLEKIQGSLARTTGLAFVTVDFRGEPVTESTSFSAFCLNMRKDPACCERCRASDAFGSIQAAVTRKSNVYLCPYGLLEVAIPIVVRGHYLGGFIGGQIRCNDVPNNISTLAGMMDSRRDEKTIQKNEHLKKDIPVYSYEHFMNIADLVQLVIEQLGENELAQYDRENALKKRIQQYAELNQTLTDLNAQKTRELELNRLNFHSAELMGLLTALTNLAVIEEAPRTYAFAERVLDYVEYKCRKKKELVIVGEELRQAADYLSLQQVVLGKRLTFTIDVPESMNGEEIPSDVLLPFVRNAVYSGIRLSADGGDICITGYRVGILQVVEITDTGAGLTPAEAEVRYEQSGELRESCLIRDGIAFAKEKLTQHYGEDYTVFEEYDRDRGSKVQLSWPGSGEEGV